MNVGNVGNSPQYMLQPNVTKPQAGDQDKTGETKQSYAAVEKEVAEGKNVKATTEAEGTKPTSDVEAFTYGALGMDHPEEVEANDDTAYTAGQVLSALGTVGAVLSILV